MEPKPFTWTKTADEIFNSPHIFNELAPAGQIVIVAAFRSSTASMGVGYIRRRCTSNAKHSSATSRGRERDRPVRISIRRNRWRTVFGWQISTAAALRTDASLSCHTRNVSNSISRSSSGRSPKPSNAAPTVLISTSGALTAAMARMEPSNTLPDIADVACPMPPPLPASTPWQCCRRQPPAGRWAASCCGR